MELTDSTGAIAVYFPIVEFIGGKRGTKVVATADPLASIRGIKLPYVKVQGVIRTFKMERALIGVNVRRITRFDDVINHLLSVFVASHTR